MAKAANRPFGRGA